MNNKQKLILGAVAVLVLIGLIGAFVFSQPTGITLNFSNNSTQQGSSSQSSGSQSGQGSGSGNSLGSDPSSPAAQYKTCPTCGGTGTITEKIYVETCARCGGSGIDPNSLKINPVSCSKCGGSGVTSIPGGKTVTETCPTCGGSGKVPA
jgi:DnaJ-class molecular chaperone